MGTTLTTPEPQPNLPYQAIFSVEFRIPHKANLAQNDIIFDTDLIQVIYDVATYDENFKIVRTDKESAFWGSIPAGFRTQLKDVYDTLITDARNKGLLGTGTDDALPV